MKPHEQFRQILQWDRPFMALAPMQDITDLPFINLVDTFGGPDFYVTEYFRVYESSCLNKHILKSITKNTTGKPVVAQMIGNDVPSLVRTARELQNFPVAGIDLNLGCPAPVVYRKCAGGGLLREPQKVDQILCALREVVTMPFTVKTRIGFDSPAVFETMLGIFAKHSLDLLTVHARTVKERYESEVHYEYIRRAFESLSCPVMANGNIYSPRKADEVLAFTGARGLMIGRAAIRNPWLFRQVRQHLRGEPVQVPTGREILAYVRALQETARLENERELSQVQRLKKFMNFLGLGVDPEGKFLHAIRRVTEMKEFDRLLLEFLDHDRPMPLEPFKLNLASSDLLAGEHL